MKARLLLTCGTFLLLAGLSLLDAFAQSANLYVKQEGETISVYNNATDALVLTQNAKAGMRPVNILGYDGLIVGVETPGLKEGMLVVVDGNERLKNGQSVIVK